MIHSLIRRITPIIILVTIVGTVALLAAIGASPGASAEKATPAPGMHMAQEFDLMFIDMMIPHHEGAIAMAEVALKDGEHQEIRDLAKAIVQTQQSEIDQLTAWRNAWYPDAPTMPMNQMAQMMSGMMQMPSMMGTPAMGMMDMTNMLEHMGDPTMGVEDLRNATGPFDQTFIEQMILHHQSAVAMAQVALQQAVHPELKMLAQGIIDTQQREIAQMQSWLAEWYGATPAAALPDVQQVDVTLSDFRVESSVTTFESNKPYLFNVTNAGAIPHEFMIMPRVEGMGQMDMETLDEMALVMIPAGDLPPGASQSIEVTFPESIPGGTLELVCAVPGHYDAGMTLTVTLA